MKKFVFTLFAVAALIACQSNNKQNQMTGEGEAVEIVGTDSTGLVDVFAYEGTVPTASGKKDSMDYLVIITQKIDSVNGVYQMTTTYITADGKSGKKINSKGAIVYKLVPDSGSNQTVNLWVESDTTVVILDDQMNTPAKPEHYRLKTVKNKK